VETGDENHDVTDNMFRAPCMFCEENLGKINVKNVELFRNGLVHEFCRLKALITLEEVNTSMVQKSRRIFMSKTSMSTCFNDVLVAVAVFVP